MQQELKLLPIGKSDITTILNNNMLYVDKTKLIYDIVKAPGSFFLSRPRRFGKSMILSTINEIFSGNKELFKEQWIYNSSLDWQVYPIIRLDFNVESNVDLNKYIIENLKLIATKYEIFTDIDVTFDSCGMYFRSLITKLHEKYKQQVVILIDEYDKPILDVITDITAAEKNRDILKGFYTVMKGVDECIRFAFLTGVTRFSKVGIFSGLNNLRDLSMLNEYSHICGITQQELEFYFKEHLELLAKQNNLTYIECLTQMKEWYNGFSFSRNVESVYNPYSTLLILQKKEFANYWFSSGNASFVIKLMKQQRDLDMFKLDNYYAESSSFDTFDIEDLNIIAILFQAGYLTIKSYDKESDIYTLSYPNKEINHSFKKNVLELFSQSSVTSASSLIELYNAFNANDLEQTITSLKQIFLNIDYDVKISYEKHYQNIFYLIFQLLGYRIKTEYKTNLGRIDAIIQTANNIYIFEFKIDKTAADALAQIKQKTYYERFLSANKPIYLVGVNFNTQIRNIDDYQIEIVK